MNSFYAYLLLDPTKPGEYAYELGDGYTIFLPYEPFYAGKGKGLRSDDHVKEAIYGIKETERSNKHKLNRIRSIFKRGHEPVGLHVKDKLSEDAAFDLERSLIKSIGRRDLKLGPLTNWSDGGEGVSNLSPATRKKHSDSQRRVRAERSEDENIRINLQISEGVTAHWNSLSDEEKAEHAAKNTLRWLKMTAKQRKKAMEGFRSGYVEWIGSLSDEGRQEALGTGSKAWWASLTKKQRAAHNKKTGDGIRQYRASMTAEEKAAVAAKTSASHKALWENMTDAERARRAQIHSVAMSKLTPKQVKASHKKRLEAMEGFSEERVADIRAKQSAGSKAHWESDGVREAHTARMRKQWATRSPEQREATKAKMRAAAAAMPVLICPHCDMEGKGSSMKRYHMDNCKHRKAA